MKSIMEVCKAAARMIGALGEAIEEARKPCENPSIMDEDCGPCKPCRARRLIKDLAEFEEKEGER